MKFILVKSTYNSLVFNIFTRFYKHHQYLILENYHHPKKEPPFPVAVTLQSTSPSASPWQGALLCALSLVICPLWSFYRNGIRQGVAFHTWLPLPGALFSGPLRYSLYQHSVPLGLVFLGLSVWVAVMGEELGGRRRVNELTLSSLGWGGEKHLEGLRLCSSWMRTSISTWCPPLPETSGNQTDPSVPLSPSTRDCKTQVSQALPAKER